MYSVPMQNIQRSIRIKWSPYRTVFHATKALRPYCRVVPRITCHNPPTPLRKGDSCLIHAAAGGVGLILIQMAKNAGATVIGTVSTQEKA
jgi:NADPH:quinone reductase-like Zn-dependent oxidoreductase